ncbi:hypothetical protein D3C73_1124320 [compost metagenome]
MRKALNQSGQQKEERCPTADCRVRGNEGDPQARARHEEHRGQQDSASPEFVSQRTEHQPANGTHQETDGEHGQRAQQRRHRVAGVEEAAGDVDRGDGIDGPVKPFQQVSYARGEQGFAL